MIKSTKFWMVAWIVFCTTGIQAYAMYLGINMPTEFTALMGGVAAAYAGLKTYQNVALVNGNGGSE